MVACLDNLCVLIVKAKELVKALFTHESTRRDILDGENLHIEWIKLLTELFRVQIEADRNNIQKASLAYTWDTSRYGDKIRLGSFLASSWDRNWVRLGFKRTCWYDYDGIFFVDIEW